MTRWQITLKEHDQKILTSSGKTVLVTLYKFLGLLYIKGLFCDADWHKLGYKTAKELIKEKR